MSGYNPFVLVTIENPQGEPVFIYGTTKERGYAEQEAGALCEQLDAEFGAGFKCDVSEPHWSRSVEGLGALRDVVSEALGEFMERKDAS